MIKLISMLLSASGGIFHGMFDLGLEATDFFFFKTGTQMPFVCWMHLWSLERIQAQVSLCRLMYE